MGASSSKQRLGERIRNARKRLEAGQKLQSKRAARMKSASPETLDVVVRSIGDSFAKCSPFTEPLLLLAFEANPEEVERIVTKSCKQVLSAPIDKAEYDWFLSYVFPSSVWMMRNKRGEYLYERMMTIADIYDALTAMDRPYKKAIPHTRALDILGYEAKAGKIDRSLLDVFIEARIHEQLKTMRRL